MAASYTQTAEKTSPMATQRTAYLVYQGAVYREALEAPKKEFRQRYDTPTTTKKPKLAPEVKERAQKWQRRFEEPKPLSDEAKQRLDEFMQRREEQEPKEAPSAPPEESKKVPLDIALTYKKIAPIWFGLYNLIKGLEDKLNERTEKEFDAYSLELLRWFTTVAKKSEHADVRAVGRLLAQIPEDARKLFRYTPPTYNEMSKYFSEKHTNISIPAIRRFITRVNQVAKDQGWNIHS